MQRSTLHVVAVFGAAIVGLTLYSWGQPLICTCGRVSLWVGSIYSSENSQQIADWYTLSHVVQGMLVVLGGRWLFPGAGFAPAYAVAIAIGVAWEIVEHSDWVLGQFRATTLYQGYRGDSVLNAVSDYVFMLGGVFLAQALPSLWGLVAVAALEMTAALMARDSLLLTSLMVVHRFEAVEAWQQELNPRGAPEPGTAEP